MANIALVKEQLITFTFALSLIIKQLKLLKEHVISQEVHMLTQRKMFTKHTLLQKTYLSKDNVNKDVTCYISMQLYMQASLSTSSVCSLLRRKELGRTDSAQNKG